MRSLACFFALASLMCANGNICLAQQRGPATLENLLNAPDRPPLKPTAKHPDRQPPAAVPDEAAVKEAQDLIKQAYEEDYKAASKNPEPLIQKLLAAASQTEEPVRKYAYLLSAEQAAATGSNYGRVMEVIDVCAQAFAIDALQLRINRLADFLTPNAKTNPEVLDRLYEHAIETAERGIKQDSLEQAESAAEMAASIAKSLLMTGKSKKNNKVADAGEVRQAQARALIKDIARRRALFAEYKQAIETLKAQDDPAANGVIGRYHCFETGDWKKGLPYLLKGDQKDVAEAAAKELKVLSAENPEPKDVFALAGNWWAVAESEAAVEVQSQFKSHAASLYASVQGRLTDPLDAQLAKSRSVQGGRPKPEPPGVGKIENTRLVGGQGGGGFEDQPPPFATIAGFVVRCGGLVDAIQVVYRLPNGELQRADKHGGNGGREEVFELLPGEQLVGISGQAGGIVGSIRFHTNRRVSKKYGAGDAPHSAAFELPLPPNAEFVGFVGKSGGLLDAVGLRYQRK
jgi:hypothetical protein